MVKILSNFVAFLENINFSWTSQLLYKKYNDFHLKEIPRNQNNFSPKTPSKKPGGFIEDKSYIHTCFLLEFHIRILTKMGNNFTNVMCKGKTISLRYLIYGIKWEFLNSLIKKPFLFLKTGINKFWKRSISITANGDSCKLSNNFCYNCNRCYARRLRVKASKVKVPLFPVAYLMYPRSSVIIVCWPLGKYN